ncbi:Cd(II)/Pb(II)-responsive transcriptional regulator [Roseateles paludis]|jgi:Cd(II)/Pb(II)-responsive transcriptional regulator|uniref:Cd(II)/Pb(II)-responsive transcriptional regulator n=1 Tax=Roseateles paludis TaxID=3145238 RepID=A0ABV0FVB3_9BURK
MKIGELARATDTPTETIRFYEREGLLPAPPRTASNYRRYGESEVRRLSLIRRCRALDMSLAEVRALLSLSDAPTKAGHEADALLDAHIGHVEARLRELKQLLAELTDLRQHCRSAAPAADCGVLAELLTPEAPPAASVRGTVRPIGRVTKHVPGSD